MMTSASKSKLVARLRRLMDQHGLSAYLVPLNDEHNTEFLKPQKNLIEQLTNFSGSFGLALLTQESASVFIDGRYWIAAPQQLMEPWRMVKIENKPQFIGEYIASQLQEGSKIGINAQLFSVASVKNFQKSFVKKRITFEPFFTNDLVAQVLSESPFPFEDIFFYKEDLSLITGQNSLEIQAETVEVKMTKLFEQMAQQSAHVLVLNQLDEIAYLLNLRGSDVEMTPLFYSYMIVQRDSSGNHKCAKLFVNKQKLPAGIDQHLQCKGVQFVIEEYEAFQVEVERLSQETDLTVWVPKLQTSYGVFYKFEKHKKIKSYSPVSLMKSIKCEYEIMGAAVAHHEEARAFFQFMVWLEQAADNNEHITEVSAAEKLKDFKDKLKVNHPKKKHQGLSFDTIFSVGPNAADIHHHPSDSVQVTKDQIILVDFGSQYWAGTTDTTRTFHLGTPTKEEIHDFTLVLKGFIAACRAILPEYSPISHLEALGRQFLNQEHKNFQHSLGHGVGAFSCVHEYPPSTSGRDSDFQLRQLKNHMFFSIEPGYYKEGSHGIRIEDVVVSEASAPGYLKISNLTRIPIQQKMMDFSLLSKDEVEFLNKLNGKIREEFAYLVDNEPGTHQWILKNTEKIVFDN